MSNSTMMFKYDPYTGMLVEKQNHHMAVPYRKLWPGVAWRYNPWTGTPRHPSDIASDPQALLLLAPNEVMRPATGPADVITEMNNFKSEAEAVRTIDPENFLRHFARFAQHTQNPTTVAVHDKTSIDDILTERGKRYGVFKEHARITQGLKDAMVAEDKWGALTADQKEALEMIAHKIGRILNGDPNYADSWDDIAGYAKLVGDRLRGVER